MADSGDVSYPDTGSKVCRIYNSRLLPTRLQIHANQSCFLQYYSISFHIASVVHFRSERTNPTNSGFSLLQAFVMLSPRVMSP
jgi:hypothetical protein